MEPSTTQAGGHPDIVTSSSNSAPVHSQTPYPAAPATTRKKCIIHAPAGRDRQSARRLDLHSGRIRDHQLSAGLPGGLHRHPLSNRRTTTSCPSSARPLRPDRRRCSSSTPPNWAFDDPTVRLGEREDRHRLRARHHGSGFRADHSSGIHRYRRSGACRRCPNTTRFGSNPKSFRCSAEGIRLKPSSRTPFPAIAKFSSHHEARHPSNPSPRRCRRSRSRRTRRPVGAAHGEHRHPRLRP